MLDYVMLHSKTIVFYTILVVMVFFVIWFVRLIQDFRLNLADQIAADLQISRTFIDIVKAAHGGDSNVQFTGQPDQIIAIQSIYEMAKKHRRVRALGIEALLIIKPLSAAHTSMTKLPIDQYVRTLKSMWW
jgi:hypothetical protein